MEAGLEAAHYSWPLAPRMVLIVLVLILLSGVFTLFEFALAACRKSRLQKEIRGGGRKAQIAFGKVLEAAENPRFLLVTARFWIIVCRAGAVFFAACAVTRYADALPPGQFPDCGVFTLAAAVLIFAVFLLGEIIPRIAGRASPEHIAAALLPLVSVCALPLRPFGFLFRRINIFLRTALGLENESKTGRGITEDELHLALVEGEKSGIVESKERTMVEGVFYLGDRPVGAFMTHRSEIQWLDVNAPAEEIRAKVMEYRDQRCFPVADGTLDEITGAAYLEDIILDEASPSPQGLRAIMKKAQFIPETMPALKAFESFKRSEANFLFVMDEYGGFAGILSVKDLVEEIVGELAAPSEEEDPIIRQEDGSWLADGSVNIDDAAKAFDLPALASVPADYHTLAGFVLSLAGELPHTGDSFSFQGFRFKVVDMDGNRIDKLLVSRTAGEREKT
jgi:putative hemolysin